MEGEKRRKRREKKEGNWRGKRGEFGGKKSEIGSKRKRKIGLKRRGKGELRLHRKCLNRMRPNLAPEVGEASSEWQKKKHGGVIWRRKWDERPESLEAARPDIAS